MPLGVLLPTRGGKAEVFFFFPFFFLFGRWVSPLLRSTWTALPAVSLQKNSEGTKGREGGSEGSSPVKRQK